MIILSMALEMLTSRWSGEDLVDGPLNVLLLD